MVPTGGRAGSKGGVLIEHGSRGRVYLKGEGLSQGGGSISSQVVGRKKGKCEWKCEGLTLKKGEGLY